MEVDKREMNGLQEKYCDGNKIFYVFVDVIKYILLVIFTTIINQKV